MNSQVNQYIIGGAVIVLILIIIYNTDATLNTPQRQTNIRISSQSQSQPQSQNFIERQVAPTKGLTPNEQMLKRIKENGLPDTDEYMSRALRAQLSEIQDRFYYDNCRYAPL
jgi:cell division protein FtsL